jgi:hypothetical protein
MNRTKLMALAIATFALGACGGGGDSTGPAPAAETGSITLLNESNSTIVAVHISGCDEGTWGANRLGAAESLAPGALRSWTVAIGCYDLKASNGVKSASWFDLEVTPGGTVQLGVPASVDAMVRELPAASASRADLKSR